MKLKTFEDLYLDQLKDLYNAENRILKALPRMVKLAHSPELKEALQHHLEVTEQQVERLKWVFESCDEKPSGKTCKAMEGIIEEAKEFFDDARGAEADVVDAGIIANAQKIEHYEISGYGTARDFAKLLNDEEAASLLDQSAKEEGEADHQLSALAQEINQRAVQVTLEESR